jgi:uncharacterized protein
MAASGRTPLRKADMSGSAEVGTARAVVAPRRQTDRLVVPDVLRGIAIFAMLVAHGVPLIPTAPGPVLAVSGQLNDLASPLFAVVMGMSAQLVFQRPGGPRSIVMVQQMTRGLILVALGVWLSMWGSWVDIVLAYLGVLAIVGAPLLYLSTRWLAGIAAVLLLVGQPLHDVVVRMLWPLVYADATLLSISQWFALGYNYRLIHLLPMFLIGVVLLRLGLPGGRALYALAAVAVVLFVVRPVTEALLGIQRAASGTYADTAHDLSLVLLCYVAVTALAAVRAPTWRRIIDGVFVPFRACGSIALSLYVVQIALIAFWASIGLGYQENEYLLWLVLVPGLMALGVLWWYAVGLGPVEWLLGTVTGRYRWRRRRSAL